MTGIFTRLSRLTVLAALALVVSPALCDEGSGEAPTPPPPADATGPASPGPGPAAIDVTTLGEAQIQRVIATYPKFKNWAQRWSRKANDGSDVSSPTALNTYAQGLSDLAAIGALEQELGMKYVEFSKDLSLVAAAYAGYRTRGAITDLGTTTEQSLAELGKAIADPSVPEEQRAMLRQQLEALTSMQANVSRTNQQIEVPDRVMKLIEKYKAPLAKLFEDGRGPSDTQDEPSDGN